MLEYLKAKNSQVTENFLDDTGNQQESLDTKVICQLCGKELWHISGAHLWERHDITPTQYKEMFPGAIMFSDRFIRRQLAGSKGSGTRSAATKLARYGTSTPNREKWTFFKKGDENPMKNENVVAKCRSSFVKSVTEKYGANVTNPIQIPGSKEKRRETSLRNWGVEEPMQHPDVKRKARMQRAKGQMNMIESNLFSLAPDKIKYVGDSSFWLLIGDRLINPDFLVEPFEETKKVIEVFGEYWHYKDNPQDRIDLFRSVGIDCVVFWGKELYPKSILKKTNVKLQEYLISSETTCSIPTAGNDIVRAMWRRIELDKLADLILKNQISNK